MDCGKEGGLGARAGDAVRDAEPGEKENPRAAQTSSPLPIEKWGMLPGALGQGHGCGIGLGKAPGHGLSSEWPGGGDLDGTQKGHTEGPPRAQKAETVPEEPLPAFPAVNSL